MTRPYLPSAFTLIEMMVTLVIATVMIFLIQVMFASTADVIRQGTGISEIIGDTRAVDAQLHKDAALMMGPGGTEQGFLMIINHEIKGEDNDIPGVPILDPRGAESLAHRGDQVSRRAIRSDQLVFVANASSLEPLCPANTTSFSGSDSVSASHARLFYGHVRQVSADQEFVLMGSLDAASGELGTDSVSSSEINLNEIATHWILGRHVLFFDGAVAANNPQVNFHPSDIDADLLLVSGYGPPGNLFVDGVTDIVDINYRTVNPDSGRKDLYLTEILRRVVQADPQRYSDYLARRFSFPNERMRVRPELTMDPEDPDSISSRHIAQQHAIFATNVSDFIVEFAADIFDNGNDGVPDGDVDRHEDGSIFWYSHFNRGGLEKLAASSKIVNPSNSGEALFSRYTVENDFRYPVYKNDDSDDSDFDNAEDDDDYPLADGIFVWRHTDGASDSFWPSLIRIRYRIHDSGGQVVSQIDGLPGRWFEQIIQVKRPST